MRERIIAQGISKKFKIGFKKKESFLSRIIHLFSGREPKKTLKALKGVSFKVNSGEIVGVIGKNGSGKSTLLRCIGGIYDFEGSIKLHGNVIPIINLNHSLHGRLSMKENIFVIASSFGLPRKKIKERLDSIIDFSELKDFIDTKVYQFSEGMKIRLAFSIAAHCEPEILLLDEVFEVGDERFRKRSVDKIKELITKGASILLISHNLDLVEKYCDRVIWLENGMIKEVGKTDKIIRDYSSDK